MARARLGEILVQAGFISQAQLSSALAEVQRTGARLGSVLVQTGVVTEQQMIMALSRQFSVPVASFPEQVSQVVLDAVPLEACERHGVFPLGLQKDSKGEILTLAMLDPTAVEVIDAIQFRTGRRVSPHVAVETELQTAIRRHYYGEKPRAEVAPQSPVQFAGQEIELSELAPVVEEEIPVVRGVINAFTPAQGVPVPPPNPPNPWLTTPVETAPVEAPTLPRAPSVELLLDPVDIEPAPPVDAAVAGLTLEPVVAAVDVVPAFAAVGGMLGAEDDDDQLEVVIDALPEPVLPAPAATEPPVEPPVELVVEDVILDLDVVAVSDGDALPRRGTIAGPPPPPAGIAPIAFSPLPHLPPLVPLAPLAPLATPPADVQTPSTEASVAPPDPPPQSPTLPPIPDALKNAPFCPDCGATRVAGAKFCPMCGCSFTGERRAKGAPAGRSAPPMPAPVVALRPATPVPAASISLFGSLSFHDIERLEGVRLLAPRTTAASSYDDASLIGASAATATPAVLAGGASPPLLVALADAALVDDPIVIGGGTSVRSLHLVQALRHASTAAWASPDDVATLLAQAPPPSTAKLADAWRDVAERPIPRKDNRTDVAVVPRSRELLMPTHEVEAAAAPAPAVEPVVTYTPAAVPAAAVPPAPWGAAPWAGVQPAPAQSPTPSMVMSLDPAEMRKLAERLVQKGAISTDDLQAAKTDKPEKPEK